MNVSEKKDDGKTTPIPVGHGTIGRAVGRRGSNTFAPASEVLAEGPLPDLELVEKSSDVETPGGERKIFLRYFGSRSESPLDNESYPTSPTLSIKSSTNERTSNIRSLSPTFAKFRKDAADDVREVGEYIVVLHLECTFATESLRFANFVSFSLPLQVVYWFTV